MSISKFNSKGITFKFQAPKTFTYYKLKDFPELIDTNKVNTIRGFFISTGGKYGEGAVMVTDTCYINLPSHMINRVKQIINDPDTVQQINEGAAGFKIRSYDDNYGKKSLTVDFVDQEPLTF